MQQFVVPQFIEVEDKIFGPITVRQFLILLVACLIIFISYKLTDFALFVAILALVGGSALVVAFVKINGQAFHYFLLNIIQTVKRPSQRVWNKKYAKKELDYFRKFIGEVAAVKEVVVKDTRRRHIRDLALIVNTGGYYKGSSET
ncbi:MAG: PrgI family protein [Patescibacteria group bacterium]